MQDKIDSDGDGFVTLAEMRNWIRFTQDRYMSEDVEKQWAQHNVDGRDELGWNDYRKLVYGFLDEDDADAQEGASYKYVGIQLLVLIYSLELCTKLCTIIANVARHVSQRYVWFT